MDYTEFIKMLFVIAGLLGILLAFPEIYEYIRYIYYRKYIYRNLNNIWKLVGEFEKKGNDVNEFLVGALLSEECEKIYHQYVINNKFLRNIFVSPNDLLIKFLAVAKGKDAYSDVKFEILYRHKSDEHEFDVLSFEDKAPKSKIRLFEKVSLGVTVIGIVVTVISFFI